MAKLRDAGSAKVRAAFKTALSTHVPTLLSKQNVQFVTVGEKRIGGRRTGTIAAVTYVLNKGDFRRSAAVPKTLLVEWPGMSRRRRIPTDVVEIGRPPRTFGARAGDVLVSSDGHTGTCGFAFEKQGVGYLMTNAHVACDVNSGGNARSMGIVDPFTRRISLAGQVIWASPLTPGQNVTMDTAIIRAALPVDNAGIVDTVNPVAKEDNLDDIAGICWYDVGGVRYYCTSPEPLAGPAPMDVEGLSLYYSDFYVLTMIRGTCAPGHSGALLCQDSPNGIIACGQIFGGADPTHVFAFSFKNAYDYVYNQV